MTTPTLHAYAWPRNGQFEARAGRFYIDLRANKILWSAEVFRLHGYRPGEVVPTLDLVQRHKHPDDRDQARRLFEEARRSGGHISNYHRIIDTKGREHKALTLARTLEDKAGHVHALEGWIADLTGPVQLELKDGERHALSQANTAVIERAKGLLMGHLQLNEKTAFSLLSVCSQSTNTKLHVLAADILKAADDLDRRSDVLTDILRRGSKGSR